MKKSELRQMIREEINKLNEDKGELNNLEYKKIKSEIEKKIAKKGQHRGMF
jgi:ribosomal protein L29